ncbi:hypothetical protein SJAV_16120 [Sulfurisphaera javensis]|uniref:Sec-independent translocation protein mttA/Hcf106 n=1 Tax=Sulfurisphaera javensis TaxID=2049879 RepID=A0AAT9GS36_9CREN
MIGSLDDFLIVVLVGILLFAGDKNSVNSIKSVLKGYNEFKKRRDELVAELRREINDIAEESSTPIRDVSQHFKQGVESLNNSYLQARNNFQDMKVKLLEERIKELEEEIEKLKKQTKSDTK